MTKYSFLREPSKQKSIALWKDQEEELEELSKKLNKPLNTTNIVREGVDKVIKELRELVTEGEGNNEAHTK